MTRRCAAICNPYFANTSGARFTVFGQKKAYIKMGGRLPTHLQGVPDTNQTFQAIQYSLQPPAPDFNAVHWRLGVEVGRARDGSVMYSRPILMTHLDLFNNDHPVTIAKDSFMGCYVPGCHGGSEGNLQLISKTLTQLQASPVDLFTIPRGPKHDLNVHKDNQGYPWCSNIRPFIYKKTTYVSCYHQDWITPPSLYHRAPEKEEMQIYWYFAETPRAASAPSFDRKMLCRFRMTAIHCAKTRPRTWSSQRAHAPVALGNGGFGLGRAGCCPGDLEDRCLLHFGPPCGLRPGPALADRQPPAQDTVRPAAATVQAAFAEVTPGTAACAVQADTATWRPVHRTGGSPTGWMPTLLPSGWRPSQPWRR